MDLYEVLSMLMQSLSWPEYRKLTEGTHMNVVSEVQAMFCCTFIELVLVDPKRRPEEEKA